MPPIDESLLYLDDESSKLATELWLEDHLKLMEENVVKRILKHAESPQLIKHIRYYSEEKTGAKAVNLNWFYELFPDFPVRLVVDKVGATKNLSMKSLMNHDKLLKTKLYDAFDNAVNDQVLGAGNIGLLFQSPASMGLMVLHNAVPAFDRPCSMIVLIGDKRKNDESANDHDQLPMLFIESLSSLLDRLQWTPLSR